MAANIAAVDLLKFAMNRPNKFHPPAETNLAYKKKGEESSGVLQMIKTIVADVEKEIQVAELEESSLHPIPWSPSRLATARQTSFPSAVFGHSGAISGFFRI